MEGKIETCDSITAQAVASVNAKHPTAPGDVRVLVAASEAIGRQNVVAAEEVEATVRDVFLRRAMAKAGSLGVPRRRFFDSTSITSNRK